MNYLYIQIVWAAIAVWVYQDAKKRGKDPATWAILTFLLGIFGLGGYWYWVIMPSNKKG